MFLLIRDDDVGFLRAVVAVDVSGNGFRLFMFVAHLDCLLVYECCKEDINYSLLTCNICC